jgi:lactate dehydrogenase-like 2-hydroxyacid dehydrogenase
VKHKFLIASPAVDFYLNLPYGEFDSVRIDQNEDRFAFLTENGRGITAVVSCGFEIFDKTILDQLPDLQVIIVAFSGIEGIDLDAARARGIAVYNSGDTSSGDVADFAVGLMLASRRKILEGARWFRDDHWPSGEFPKVRSISKERVGIVGFGHIGRSVAARIAPFRSEIAWWGPRRHSHVPFEYKSSLIELARWATVLFVTVRADENTRLLIGAETLDALGPDGLIINVSRGSVIDEPALRDALRTGRLGAAALDVFEHEPARGTEWRDVPNILPTPHLAGGTFESLEGVEALAIDNIRRLCDGRELRHRLI